MRWRTLHIDERCYRYHVGNTVVILTPDNVKHLVNTHEIKGLTPDEFEKGQWKQTGDGMIAPSEVKDWIIKNLLQTEAS